MELEWYRGERRKGRRASRYAPPPTPWSEHRVEGYLQGTAEKYLHHHLALEYGLGHQQVRMSSECPARSIRGLHNND